MTQHDLLARKIMELKVPYQKKDRYIHPHERRMNKEYEDCHIENILLLILHKLEEHYRELKEIKENVSRLNQMTCSHSISIHLTETQIGQVFSHLHPKSEVKMGTCII